MNRSKILTAILCAFGAAAASAQQPQTTERVEITGSSIKRIEGETALPVQFITREDIQRSGAVNVEQLLQTVTAATSAGNFVTATMSGASTQGISTVSLRGLAGNRTLVLVNGRRVTSYALITGNTGAGTSVDVNSIPIAAIDRIEVLKDGASAVYGSDAIGGVVNFILRRDYRGAEITVDYGTTTEGGGDVTRLSGVYGIGDLSKDRYNVLVVPSYQREKALFGRDREFAMRSIFPERLQDGSSGNTFPANINIPGFGNFNPNFPNNCAPSTTSPFFPNVCRFDPSPLVGLLPETERWGIFAAARLALTQNLEAFLEASFNRNEQQSIIQPVPLSDQFALPPNHPLFSVAPYNGAATIILQPSSPFYPTAFVQNIVGAGNPLPDVRVRYRSVITGNRDITDTADQPRVALGLKGSGAGWDFDTALTYSASKVTEKVNNGYPSQLAILPLLNSGQVNFFGPNTPAIQAQADATQFRGTAFVIETSLTGIGGKASRELVQLPAGPLAVAFGADARDETYKLNPDPLIQSGDISGYGGNQLPVNVSRNAYAVFAELNAPIVKSLEGNVAVRFDEYEGTGNKTTGKIGLRWQPTRAILLRGSYGTGFRAPSLTELFAPVVTGVTPNGVSDPLRCPTTSSSTDCATQFPITLGGNTNLKPEKSENTTLGLVFEPTANTSLALDYFRIDLEETIQLGILAATILAGPVQFANLITRGPVDPNFPNLPGPITNINQSNLNIGKTLIRGVEADFKFAFPAAELGRFTANLIGTYFIKYDTENTDGSFTGNVGVASGTGGLIPRWRHYLSAGWSRGPWGASLAQTYQKAYKDVPATFEDPTLQGYVPRTVGSYFTYDTQATYSGFKGLALTLGIKNIFDRDPPATNAGGSIFFQGGYDPSYADPRGRFVYGRVNYKFL